MEEIKGTEALEREILEDASKKADRIVRKAKEDADKMERSSSETLEKKIAEMDSQKREKLSQLEKEILSKLPLEKTRLRARFVDQAMTAAIRRFLDSLGEAELGAWCLSELKKRSALFEGGSFSAKYRGIDAASVRGLEGLLGRSLASPAAMDPGASRRGVVVASLDGAMITRITELELEQWLLDEKRGDLASSLFPAALEKDDGQ